jgi:nickel-dependent lactate racemase
MLGDAILGRYQVVDHDARDAASLEDVGVLGDGVPVALNRLWLEADLRITTGFVEPHFFAGFSGGPKMVAPGLAGIDTVMTLHDARRIGSPLATWGVTEGNPVHDDVRAIARETGVSFALDVLLDREQQVTAVFAGELLEMHAAACRAAKREAMRALPGRFDVVLTTNSGYPLDQNLYQAVKGMSAAARVVRPGGTIVCAAECRDGLPDHGSYAELLRSRPTPAALLELIEGGARVPDQWQVQIQARIQQHARVLLHSGLEDELVRAAHLEPVEDVAAATAGALAAAGPGSTLCVLPEGPATIPYVEHETA